MMASRETMVPAWLMSRARMRISFLVSSTWRPFALATERARSTSTPLCATTLRSGAADARRSRAWMRATSTREL